MPDNANALQTLRFTACSTPFSDAPLGKFGGASVSMKAPQGARSAWGRFTDQIKSLAERSVLALAPAATRTKAEVRTAAKAFSAHLGDALGALSDTEKGLHETEAKTAVLALLSDARQLSQHDIHIDDVLPKRLDMHLEQLDRTQLAALVKGARSDSAANVAMSDDFEDKERAGLVFGMIANRASERLAKSVLDDIGGDLETGLAKLTTSIGTSPENELLQQWFALNERVVSALSVLAETGAMSFPNGVSAAAKGYIDKAMAQLPEADRKRLETSVESLQALREEAHATFQQSISDFVAAARSAKLGDAVDSAARAHQALQTLSRTHDVQPSYVDTAIAALPQEDREALAAFFAQPDARGLANVCSDLGAGQALAERDPALAKQLNGMSVMLAMIARAADSPIPKRDRVAAGTRPGSDLSPEASAAIFGHFSIVVGKGGLPGPLPTRLAQHYADKFQGLIPKKPSETDPSVNSWFEKDIGRASYVIDGKPMDKKNTAATKAALLAISGSPEMAMAVSRIANQRLLINMFDLLLRQDDGAIRLPDGRSIHPQGGDAGQSKIHIDINKNQNGEIIVIGRTDYTDINRVKDSKDYSIDVEPGAEIHYSVEITLSADGSPRISRPLEFQISSLAVR